MLETIKMRPQASGSIALRPKHAFGRRLGCVVGLESLAQAAVVSAVRGCGRRFGSLRRIDGPENRLASGPRRRKPESGDFGEWFGESFGEGHLLSYNLQQR
jgi:hypothetical protein